MNRIRQKVINSKNIFIRESQKDILPNYIRSIDVKSYKLKLISGSSIGAIMMSIKGKIV
jgi:hypothetical protein